MQRIIQETNNNKSWVKKQWKYGFKPENNCVTQLMNYENILFNNLDRTFQKQFCVRSGHILNGRSYGSARAVTFWTVTPADPQEQFLKSAGAVSQIRRSGQIQTLTVTLCFFSFPSLPFHSFLVYFTKI